MKKQTRPSDKKECFSFPEDYERLLDIAHKLGDLKALVEGNDDYVAISTFLSPLADELLEFVGYLGDIHDDIEAGGAL